MSRKERNRMTIMVGIQQGELTLRAAAPVLGLSYRQTRRVWRRYQAQGDAGLVHRRRVLFVRSEYWIVVDEVTGEGRHTCCISRNAARAAWRSSKGSRSVPTI